MARSKYLVYLTTLILLNVYSATGFQTYPRFATCNKYFSKKLLECYYFKEMNSD